MPIEAMALLRQIGAIHAVEIQLAVLHPGEVNVPDVAGAVGPGVQFKFVAGSSGGRLVKQHQPDSPGVAAKDGEVGAVGGDGRAQRHGATRGGLDGSSQL